MPKASLPKIVYIYRDRDPKGGWLLADENLEDCLVADHDTVIGTYELKEVNKARLIVHQEVVKVVKEKQSI